MEHALQWIRQNPTWFALSFATACTLGVSVVLAVLMRRAGVSLKPLVFFLVYLGIIGGPQGLVHFLDAWHSREKPASPPSVAGPSAPVSWEQVFGADADASLQTDARTSLAAALPAAEDARLSFNPRGESALAARFPSPAAAMEAYQAYLRFFGLVRDGATHATTETSAQRYQGQGEWTQVLVAGQELYAWTGPTQDSVVRRREQVLGSPTPVRFLPSVSKSPVSDRLRANHRVMFLFVGLNLIAGVLWFFKGSAWCARENPQANARPLSPPELKDQLLALNRAGNPVNVTTTPEGTGLVASWHTADSQWLDRMRLHRVRILHRLDLSFDVSDKTVRVTEYRTAFDGSAGPSGLKAQWHFSTGLTFFERSHQGVLGVQLDTPGRPTGDLSATFRFDSVELKQPLARVVTSAGWTWQPVVLISPPWLRWLTE